MTVSLIKKQNSGKINKKKKMEKCEEWVVYSFADKEDEEWYDNTNRKKSQSNKN